MKALGDLENAIMHVIWASEPPLTVRDVLERLRSRGLAYTTVMTVMDRLWKKRLLTRKAQGRAYVYRASLTESEYTARLMHDLLAATGDKSGALAHFVERMRPGEEEEIRRLAAKAKRRRGSRP